MITQEDAEGVSGSAVETGEWDWWGDLGEIVQTHKWKRRQDEGRWECWKRRAQSHPALAAVAALLDAEDQKYRKEEEAARAAEETARIKEEIACSRNPLRVNRRNLQDLLRESAGERRLRLEGNRVARRAAAARVRAANVEAIRRYRADPRRYR